MLRCGIDYSAILSSLRTAPLKSASQRCADVLQRLTASAALPEPCDTIAKNECPCPHAISLLRRSQPAMLDRWTPVATEGDGNCMFRAVSLALFGTQLHHMHLRLRTCLEVGINRSTYDRDHSDCHPLLTRDNLLPPSYPELWQELCKPGRSCCYVALIALSTVLQVRIYSYFPPLQSTFVAALTVDIMGLHVPMNAKSIAVMWSSAAEVSDVGEVAINHLVALRRRAVSSPPQCNTTAAVIDDDMIQASDVSDDDDGDTIAAASDTSASEEDFECDAAVAAATSDDSCDAADIRSTSPQPKKTRVDEPAASTAALQFQDITQLLDTLRTTTDVSTGIPCGPKNNVRFVTRLSLDERTGRASYADDCGAWNAKTSTTTCTLFAIVDGRLLFVKLRDGIYCRGGRKGVWQPLQPQPQPQDVVRAHRHYATLRADDTYKKRVTWFSNVPDCEQLAVVEYQGVHPGVNQPHGNARHIDRPFVRTHPDTLRRVDEKVTHRPPRDVYESMVREDSVNAPRDLQQV